MAVMIDAHPPRLPDAGVGAATVPPELCGLWRRVVLETPDAPPDTTTRVYWLQTPTLYVDLRIPSPRVLAEPRADLASASDADLAVLATQAGFAGQTFFDGGLCRWLRAVDYQPPTGIPDEGRLEIGGERIVEHGVHVPYREVWERVEHSIGDWIARSWVEPAGRSAGRICHLVTGGDWFLFSRARAGAGPLPPAWSLAELIATRGFGRTEIAALLDFEISLGRRGADGAPWIVELSTLPAREGQPLDAALVG